MATPRKIGYWVNKGSRGANSTRVFGDFRAGIPWRTDFSSEGACFAYDLTTLTPEGQADRKTAVTAHGGIPI